jgi:hypothetical protein
MFLEIHPRQILGVQVAAAQLVWRPNYLNDIFLFQLSQKILSRFHVASTPSHIVVVVRLLALRHLPVRAHTDARKNPSAQRATQLRRVLAHVYAVSIQNVNTNTVP